MLYGHVFRNAMLLIVAGFPAAFIGILFTVALLVEIIFSLDGLGLLGFEAAIQPRLSGDVRHALHLHPARPACMQIVGDMTYTWSIRASTSRPAAMMGRKLSPLTRRRLANFRANRRGYLVAVDFSGAVPGEPVRRVHRQRPAAAGRLSTANSISRFSKTIPRPIFGGDLPIDADYRDMTVAKRIEAHGWVLWPPIPYDYDTINFHLPSPAPSPPAGANLLGTDDQGRDVLARLIYGFRISVLFGLVLTVASSIVGVAAGAIQGYYGGLTDLLFQRFSRSGPACRCSICSSSCRSIIQPEFLVAARRSCCCSRGCRWSAWCAPNSCGRAISTMCAPPRRSVSANAGDHAGATSCPTRWWRR